MRRSHILSLLIVTVVAVASLAGVLIAGWSPVLGVQLQGGVEVVLQPTGDVTEEQLDRAIEIIRDRVDALGVAEPDITRQGGQVVIQLPGVKDRQRAVDLVGKTAELRFRPVQFAFDADDAEARAGAAEFFELLAGLETEVAPPTSAPASETGPEDGSSVDDAAPVATTSVPATTTTVPATTTSTTVLPTTSAAETTTSAVPATTVAPTTTVFDPESAPSLADLITPPEEDLADRVVLLPGREQPGGLQIAYILREAALTGEVVAEANATFQNGAWVVLVDFDEEGSIAFDAMAAANFGQQVAIALDGVVESAPTINATNFDGRAVISGSFTEQQARDLAVVLRFGALPVEFEQDDVRTVSPTLGQGTLRAGVVAGLVGLILVGLYMVLYYRLLGLVAVASLGISGALLWSIIAWLGESRGLALTLAGTTGIIVSIGVQVDSNIVYYERIREEIRRGRAVRSAADASFAKAFRTIVWADLASLIGALVLYRLTSGTVRGFALFLGISTLIDIVVSYVFMRPLVVVLARKLIGERPERVGVVVSEEVPS